MAEKIGRRGILRLAGGGLAWNVLDGMAWAQSTDEVVEIKIINIYRTALWYFDPVGIHIQPGQKVRWTCTKWGGTVTAYHPSNLNRELRIPESAQPFDSGTLLQGDTPRARYEMVFEQEGTYDYFSSRHEVLGTVGRIVVGSPGGPAGKPMGYGIEEGRAPTYEPSRKLMAWLTPERIMKEKRVRFPSSLLARTYPTEDSPF